MKNCLKLALGLALTVVLGANARAQERCGSKAPDAPPRCAGGSAQQLMRFATELDGDHSLDTATVAEQGFGNYARYTLKLQFTSGQQQSIAINAPQGGLQPEMLDMSGDNIPNDLVLTSRLLRWPLVVLLNDGHDHLTVAVAPGRFASREDRASGGHAGFRAAVLVSPRLRLPGLSAEQKLPGVDPFERFIVSTAAFRIQEVAYACDFGRPPPAFPVHG